MATKKKVAVTSSKNTAKPRRTAAKPGAITAPAPAEQLIAEAPPAVESASVVEVEAVAPATVTATTTIEPPAKKPAKTPTSKQTSSIRKKDRPTKGIAALLYETRFAISAFFALESIGTRFDERERSGLRNLRRFGIEHAKKIANGQKADERQLDRTIGLARWVAELFEGRFYAIMNDSFILFDKGLKELERTSPEYLVRDDSKIKLLRDGLRDILARVNATYDETVDAYKAMMAYVPSVSEEAEQIVEAERARRRQERSVADATALLTELDELAELDI